MNQYTNHIIYTVRTQYNLYYIRDTVICRNKTLPLPVPEWDPFKVAYEGIRGKILTLCGFESEFQSVLPYEKGHFEALP